MSDKLPKWDSSQSTLPHIGRQKRRKSSLVRFSNSMKNLEKFANTQAKPKTPLMSGLLIALLISASVFILWQRARDASLAKLSICGDGVCAYFESEESCPSDCKGTCGDSFCDVKETCKGAQKSKLHECKTDCGLCGSIEIPNCVDAAGLDENYHRSMFWGTYSPHLFCSIKTRSPEPIVANVLWHSPDSPEKARYEVTDKFQGTYQWVEHDGRTLAHQMITDEELRVQINTTLVKLKQDSVTGGEWSLRVTAEAYNGDSSAKDLTFVVHLGLLGEGWMEKGEIVWESGMQPMSMADDSKIVPMAVYKGWTPVTGDFGLTVVSTKTIPDTSSVKIFSSRERNIDRSLADVCYAQALGGRKLMQEHHHVHGSNFGLVQITLPMPIELDIAFMTWSDSQLASKATIAELLEAAASQTGDSLSSLIKSQRTEFLRRFEHTFGLSDKKCQKVEDAFVGADPCHRGRYTDQAKASAVAALSQVMGHLSYSSGTWHAASANDPKAGREMGNLKMFGTVPYRHGVPSLWEEGFSLMLIHRWDAHVARDIMLQWLNTMQEGGWIPRRQVLGDAARKRVPLTEHAQHPRHGNPPTMMIALEEMLDDGSAPVEFVKCISPRLVQWLDFYRRTQRGAARHTYAWYGREKGTSFATGEAVMYAPTAGMTDYPRSRAQDTSRDAHLDLTSWVALMFRVLRKLEHASRGDEEGVSLEGEWAMGEDALLQHIEAVHWNEEALTYQDRGWGPGDDGKKTGVVEFADHEGYVSAMPLILGLLPKGRRLELVLEPMRDLEMLRSSSGIRSMTRKKRTKDSDGEYGRGLNRWRGMIYVPINYLLLRALATWYSSRAAREVYRVTRAGVVANVLHLHQTTGTFWEAYEPGVGHLAKQQSWTALVVLIMAEMY